MKLRRGWKEALAEVIKTVIAPAKKLTLDGEWDLELIGELFGEDPGIWKLF